MKKLTKLTAYLVSFIMVISTVSFTAFAEVSEDVQAVYDALTEEMLTSLNEPQTSVTKSLNLDLSDDIAIPEGVTVSFASSNTAVIANDGSVDRDANVEKNVTLTATISKDGSESLTKELKFTVLPLTYEVLSSNNAYYPAYKGQKLVSYDSEGTLLQPVSAWSISNSSQAQVENNFNGEFSQDAKGYYNITATRPNLTGAPDSYVRYGDVSIPATVQTSEDNCVSIKISFNPVKYGKEGANHLYLRLYCKDYTEKMIAYVQLLPTQTKLVTPDSTASAYVTSSNHINSGVDNTLEIKLDYNKSVYYFYLNGTPINNEGIVMPKFAFTRQLECIHFGYLRTMQDSVLQVNDITIAKETPYKVKSLDALTEEMIAGGQTPDFITESLDFPANSDITWESSNPDVISNDGTVTRPTFEDASVTLTATTAEGAKELNFTVKSFTVSDIAVNKAFMEPFAGDADLGGECDLFSQQDAAKTTYAHSNGRYFINYNSTVSGEESASTFRVDTTTFPLGNSGKYMIEFDASFNNSKNTVLTFLSDDRVATAIRNNGGNITVGDAVCGTVTEGEWDRFKVIFTTFDTVPYASVYMNGTLIADNVALENSAFTSSIGFSLSAEDASTSAPATVNIDNLVLYTEISSGDLTGVPGSIKADFLSKLISYNTVTNGKHYDLENNLDLNAPFADYALEDLGVNIEWTSSNPDVISNSGVVTRSEKNEYVKMTATITARTGDDTATVTKTLPFTVAAADSKIHTVDYTFDSYENNADAGWVTTKATAAVKEVQGRSGKVLEADFESSGASVRREGIGGGTHTNRYFVSMDVCFDPDSNATIQYIELMLTRIKFNFQTGGISLLSSEGELFYTVPGAKAETDRWYHIDIDFNAARKNYMVYIDGAPVVASPVDIRNPVWVGWLYMRTLNICSDGPGKAYIDNVTIRESNEKAPAYDPDRDFTIRRAVLTNEKGATITNPAHDATLVKANIKVIKNREPVEGESKVYFARYDAQGKLQQFVVSDPLNTKAPGYETYGQILDVEMPLTGDCSDNSFKIFIMSDALNPYTAKFDSYSPQFDTQRLFNLPVNAVLASELGYEAKQSNYDGIEAIMYDGDTYNGRPVKYFAYIGLPEGASEANPVPAVVCLHGGTDTAQDQWVKYWNDHGYAAIAMDLNGRIPVLGLSVTSLPRHAWAGASQDNYSTIFPHDAGWMYSNVTAAICANNLLRSMPEIDSSKIGIAGISWGGVSTSTTIGVDNRFAFAIPSFGCGYLYDSETWMADYMTEEKLRWEPSRFIAKAECPILWMNGDKDTAFSITSTSKSSLCGGDNSYTAIIPGYNHGNGSTWSRVEPYAFADSIVNGGQKFIRGTAVQNGNTVVATTDRAASKATLRYMTADELYFENGTKATYDVTTVTTSDSNTDTFTFTLPSDATMFYVTFEDSDGNHTSTVLYDVK